jgi:hypothetical protein
MAGAYFIWKDILQGATGSYTHVGAGSSSVVSTLPQANMLDRRLAKVCRMSYAGLNSTSEMRHTFNLAAPPPEDIVSGQLSAVVICGWRILEYPGAAMQFRVRDSVLSPSFDSGWITDSWLGATSSLLSLYVLPSTTAPSQIIVSFRPHTAGGVPGTGTLDIGRAFAGRSINMPKGVDAQFSVATTDAGRSMRSRGQQMYSERLPRVRTLSCKLSQMTAAQCFGSPFTFMQMAKDAGTSDDVVIVPRSSGAGDVQQLAIYGRLTKSPVLQHAGDGLYATDFDVEEAL